MSTLELFYPEKRVTIGAYTFTDGINLEAHSSKKSYFDWARVRFTRQFQDRLTIPARTPATISLGYDGIFSDVFQGYITKPYNGGDIDTILMKDAMLLLDDTKINNTFLDATPQDLIRFGLQKAGVTQLDLASTAYPMKSRVPVCQKSVIEVLLAINTIWGISVPFFFSGGVFHWGTAPQQKDIYSFVYGENILSLDRSDGLWIMETVSVPFVGHSQRISIEHPRVTGIFDVDKVDFTTNDAGFIRTTIYF